jgi:hypothetical protein
VGDGEPERRRPAHGDDPGGDDAVEPRRPEVDAGDLADPERRPSVGHRGRVSALGGLDHRRRPVDPDVLALREVVENGGRRHSVAAADLEHAVGGRQVEPFHGPGEAGRRSHPAMVPRSPDNAIAAGVTDDRPGSGH